MARSGWQFDGYQAFDALDATLEARLKTWLRTGRADDELPALLTEISAYVQGYMDLDPLGRAESYLINTVPLSPVKRRFLVATLELGTPPKLAPLRAYLKANRLWAAKTRTRPKAQPRTPPQAPRPDVRPPSTTRCPACGAASALTQEVFVPCGVSVPNPIGLRDTWRRAYLCPTCGGAHTVETDA